jgi:two-component system chemotaxis response regulator CheB
MNAYAPATRHAPQPSASDQIRVMVVDDAVVVRSLVSRWIEETPDLKLVAALRNGREAVEQLDQTRPDVVVLDIEMPELDGISTLPKLLERRRDLVVIMASALTRDHAEVTLKALSLGAADYIPKPTNEGGMMTSAAFQRDLIAGFHEHIDDFNVFEVTDIGNDNFGHGTASSSPRASASFSARKVVKRTPAAPSITRWS